MPQNLKNIAGIPQRIKILMQFKLRGFELRPNNQDHVLEVNILSWGNPKKGIWHELFRKTFSGNLEGPLKRYQKCPTSLRFSTVSMDTSPRWALRLIILSMPLISQTSSSTSSSPTCLLHFTYMLETCSLKDSRSGSFSPTANKMTQDCMDNILVRHNLFDSRVIVIANPFWE